MPALTRLLVVFALAAALIGCIAPASPSPVDDAPTAPATALPTAAAPGSSSKPGRPTPTIEIPPPIY